MIEFRWRRVDKERPNAVKLKDGFAGDDGSITFFQAEWEEVRIEEG
jgi:hypothetical protein